MEQLLRFVVRNAICGKVRSADKAHTVAEYQLEEKLKLLGRSNKVLLDKELGTLLHL